MAWQGHDGSQLSLKQCCNFQGITAALGDVVDFTEQTGKFIFCFFQHIRAAGGFRVS